MDKKRTFFLFGISESINWSATLSQVLVFEDSNVDSLLTSSALCTAKLRFSSSRDPFTPSITISLGPVTLKPAIGVPHARASIRTIPNVSVLDGNTKHAASL